MSFQQACRARKNFSSLYAIVSALKSNPIHRLRKTWQDTDRSEAAVLSVLVERLYDQIYRKQSKRGKVQIIASNKGI